MRFPTAILATVTLLAVALVPMNTSAVTGKDCYAFDPNPPTTPAPGNGGPLVPVVPPGSTVAPDGAPHCVYYATGTFKLGTNAVQKVAVTDCSEKQTGLNYACAYVPPAASDNDPLTGGDDYFVADFAQEGDTGGCSPAYDVYHQRNGIAGAVNSFVHQNPSVPSAAKIPNTPDVTFGLAGLACQALTTPQVCFLDSAKAPIKCWTPAKYANRVGDGLCSPISTEPRIVPTGSAFVAWSADIGVNNIADVYVFNCPPFPKNDH